jgi:uncharacterized protein YegL
MADPLDQIPFQHGVTPFEGAIFAENPEPRCPCILLLDTSSSMAGAPITELNIGLRNFRDELAADTLASRRVELAVVTFGPVQTKSDFQTADTFEPPKLEAHGATPMGAAIEHALAMLRLRKVVYRQNGVEFFRPWVFLVTDGAPTDHWQDAARMVKEGEDARQFQFFAVGVEGANYDILRQISVREPLKLQGLRFRDLFAWLSNSLSAVSHSQVGEQVSLENPTIPGGWATVG